MPHNKTRYHYHNFITHSYSVTKLTNHKLTSIRRVYVSRLKLAYYPHSHQVSRRSTVIQILETFQKEIMYLMLYLLNSTKGKEVLMSIWLPNRTTYSHYNKFV